MNSYAESAADVGEGLSKSASILSDAGASIEESAALFTGGMETIQDASKMGNALKVSTMRIRGMSGALVELGEEVDDSVDNISKMQGQILNLTNGQVNIFDEDGNFKNITQIYRELANVIDDIDEKDRADLIEKISGKHNANAILAMLRNWSQVEKAISDAENSTGTARAEQEKWAQSLDGYLQRLHTSWQVFSNDFLNSGFIKGAVGGLTGIVNGFDSMAKVLGSLGSMSLTAANGNILFQLLKNKGNGLKELTSKLKEYKIVASELGVGDALKYAASDLKDFFLSPAGIITAVGLATTAISTLSTAYSNYRQKIEEDRQKEIDEAKQSAQETENIMSLYSEYQQAKSALDSTAESKNNLASASTNLLTALGTEESKIGGLIKNYDKLDSKISDMMTGSNGVLQKNIDEATEGFNAAYDNFNDSIGKSNDIIIKAKAALGDTKLSNSLSFVEKDAKTTDKIANILKGKGLLDSYDGDIGVMYLKNGDIEEAAESYQKLLSARQELNQAVEDGRLTKDEYNSSNLVNKLDKDIAKYEEAIGAYTESRDILNEALASKMLFEGLENNGIPKTTEELEALRNTMLETAKASGKFEGSAEDIENAFDGVFDSFVNKSPVLKSLWNDLISKQADDALSVSEKAQKKLDNRIKFEKDTKDFDDAEAIREWVNSLSDEDKEIVYTLTARSDATSLKGLKEDLKMVSKYGKTGAEQMQLFSDIITDESDGNFSQKIDDYTNTLSSLQDLYSKVDTGQLTDLDKINAVKAFPELAPYINDTKALKNEIRDLINTSNEGINEQINAQIEELAGNSPLAATALETVRDMINGISKVNRNFNYDNALGNFNNMYGAMKESVSPTGLSLQSKKNIEAMYSGLEGYDPSKLFERTYNGIHLNTNELRNLQAQYESTQKAMAKTDLDNLVKEYDQLQNEISLCADANQRAILTNRANSLKDQITEAADLATQYEALTSSYNKWIQAQSIGEEGDMYRNLVSGLETANQMAEEGRTNSNFFRSYVDAISGKDLTNASVAEVEAEWSRLGETIEGTSYSAKDFLAEGRVGADNFFDAITQLQDPMNKLIEDDGTFNFGYGDDQKIADMLGLDVGFVQSLLRLAAEYTDDINLDSIFSGADDLTDRLGRAKEALEEIRGEDVDINIKADSLDEINSELEKSKTLLDEYKNSDGQVDTSIEGATEAEAIFTGLLEKKKEAENPILMSIDTSGIEDSNLADTITSLADFQNQAYALQGQIEVGADTSEAESAIQATAAEIQGMSPEMKAQLGLDSAEVDAALSSITDTDLEVGAHLNLEDVGTVQDAISGADTNIEATIHANVETDTSAVDSYEPEDKEAKATYTVDAGQVNAWQPPHKSGKVTYTASMIPWNPPNKTATVTYNVVVNGSPPVSNGTASVFGNGLSDGTAYAEGTAFSRGSWGAKSSGVALGGEVGQELVVRRGRFFTIGDEGAEFFKYQKDDIMKMVSVHSDMCEK